MNAKLLAPQLRDLPVEELLSAIAAERARVIDGKLVPLLSGGSTAPAFTATPNVGLGLVPGTLDTSLTAPTNVTTVFTAGASGSKVDQVTLTGVGTTVAGVVNLFILRSAVYYLVDQFLITALTSSTTAIAFTATHTYENFLLANGDVLKVTNTVSGNQSLIQVACYGGDF